MNHPQPAPGQPPKSGGALKWVLLGCGSLLLIGAILIGISVYLVSRNVSSDPAKVEAAAQEIVKFEKPDGYKGVFSMSMMGVKSAVFAGEGGGSIAISQIPADPNSRQQFEAQFKESMKKRGQVEEVAEQRKAETFKVRGQDVAAQVNVLAHQGSEVRSLQYTITLDAVPGSILLIAITGPEKTHDHAWVQKFLDTIK